MKQEHIVIIVSALLFLFLAWKEMKRPSRAQLSLRLVTTALAVAALACIIVPVSWTTKRQLAELKELLLLTSGASNDLPAQYKKLKTITTDPELASATIEFVPDLAAFVSAQNDISGLHIFGQGLNEQEWAALNTHQIKGNYHPPASPAGFTKANWPRVLQQGDKLLIEGNYNNTDRDSIKIILKGLGTTMDSVIIHGDSSQSFRLQCQPAHSGATLYELQALHREELIREEKLPVNILPASKPRVLFLSSSPGFETKFLGSWLYQNSYPAAIRNNVSLGKYDHQFLNMPAVSLQNISSSLLANFDVLIADDLALASLKATESAAVKAEVSKGLGLILQTDSTVSLSGFSKPFGVRKQAGHQAAARALRMAGLAAKTKPLAGELWFSIQSDPFSQALVTDEQQAAIVSSRLSGAGKIVLNTAAWTYSWILSGNEENYSAFWSLLIGQAARPEARKTRWQYRSAFPTTDEATELVLEAAASDPPVIKTGGAELYTTQTSYLPDTWTATWWPVHPGWQTLASTDTVSMYVFEEGDWSTAKASELISRNNMHAAQQKSIERKHSEGQQQRNRVPVVVFYLIFLAAVSYLWWEAKRA